jgi:Tfp pilus assembly protein PilF/mono/diheme cytochrome c family protein
MQERRAAETRRLATALLLVSLLLAACPRLAAAQAAAPTFARDVAPILYRHCGSCHNPRTDAPFSLLTYDDVRPRAQAIAAATTRREMPPWKPAPGYGDEFLGARRLTDEEIATIQRWAAAGAPQGDPAGLGPPPPWNDGWRLGTPDLIVRMAEPYDLVASGPDLFRIVVLPIPANAVRYVKAIEFQPGTRAVHHANLRIDTTPASRLLDDADAAPGYDGLIARSAQFPEGHFFGWTPGQLPPMSPDLAWRLQPGSDFVVQLHMRPTGKPEPVQVAIGLYFADGPPRRTPAMLRLGRQSLDIAPGQRGYVVRDSYVLPVDVDVHAVQPHAHYRATQIKGIATLPDGTTKWLLNIPDWDFNWQDQYRYARPFPLPKGTTLSMEYTYDNSAANRHNPQRPPQRVRWGQNSTDEMGDLWIQVVPRSAADLARLMNEFRQKVFREDIEGYETVLRTTPDDVALHDDIALLYLETGRVADAIRHFRESLSLAPVSAQAHFNLATSLIAGGRLDEAVAEYRRAIELKPDYAAPYNNLGSIALARGRADEAATLYRRAADLDPANAEAHNNLGYALTQVGRLDDALASLGRALEIRPAYPEAHLNLARLLLAQGKPRDALARYGAALALRPDWPPVAREFAWMLAALSVACNCLF